MRAALAMVDPGAGGTTALQVEMALHLDPDEKIKAVNPFQNWGPGRGDAMMKLEVINSIRGQWGYPFRPEFGQKLKADDSADFQTVEFVHDPEAVRGQINQRADVSTQSGKLRNAHLGLLRTVRGLAFAFQIAKRGRMNRLQYQAGR